MSVTLLLEVRHLLRIFDTFLSTLLFSLQGCIEKNMVNLHRLRKFVKNTCPPPPRKTPRYPYFCRVHIIQDTQPLSHGSILEINNSLIHSPYSCVIIFRPIRGRYTIMYSLSGSQILVQQQHIH